MSTQNVKQKTHKQRMVWHLFQFGCKVHLNQVCDFLIKILNEYAFWQRIARISKIISKMVTIENNNETHSNFLNWVQNHTCSEIIKGYWLVSVCDSSEKPSQISTERNIDHSDYGWFSISSIHMFYRTYKCSVHLLHGGLDVSVVNQTI